MIVAVPKILREKLTDEGAEALVQIIDKVEERSQQGVMQMAEERFEKRVAQVEAKMESRFAQMEAKMAQGETKLIRWMFVFWIGQSASTAGVLATILFAFFKPH